MIALHMINNSDSASQLWNVARPISLAHGNRISHAHLKAAAAGFGSAQLHDAINALLHARKSELQNAVRALGRIGQTSGWDTLAGAVTTYRARFAKHDFVNN